MDELTSTQPNKEINTESNIELINDTKPKKVVKKTSQSISQTNQTSPQSTAQIISSNYSPPSDYNAEGAMLGLILLNNSNLDEIADKLKPEFFADPRNGRVYKSMLQLSQNNKPIDVLFTLNQLEYEDNLQADNRNHKKSGVDKDYLIGLVSKTSLATSVNSLLGIIKDKYKLRKVLEVSEEIKELVIGQTSDSNDILDQAQKKLFEVSIDNSEKNFVAISDILMDSFERLADTSGTDEAGIPTGFVDVDKKLGGLHNSDLIILAARPSMGKAQPIDTPIRTINGWTKIKDLKIGDSVASTDGAESMVQGIFPQGQKQVYRITFSDGRSTLCCKEHLWNIKYRDWSDFRTLTTEKLMNKLQYKRYQNRLFIPSFEPNFDKGNNTPNNLELDPYILGCILGDGGLTHTTPVISGDSPELLKAFEVKLNQQFDNKLKLVKTGKYDYRISQIDTSRQANPLTGILKKINLYNLKSEQKFIPQNYLESNYESRLELLSGLLDTDGWVEKTGSVRFSSSSQQLALDVQTLVRSLGGYCRIRTKETQFSYNGQKKQGKQAFILNICNLQHLQLFKISSKQNRVNPKSRIMRLNIVSIVPESTVECACILVSNPNHLYIANDYIVTHNTSFCLEVAKRIAMVQQVGVAIFSLEMSKEQLVDKLISSTSGVDSWKLRTRKFDESADEFSKIGEAISRLAEAPIWIDDAGSLNVLELRTKARRLKTKHNVGLLIIDYLQLMSGTGKNYNNNRVQEVSEISRGLKILAKELQIPIVALSQLSRSVEGRDDKRPMLSDLRESGSIEQDADVVMFIHREEMYNKETKRKGIADLLVAKHRHGETCSVELGWVGRLATFENLDQARVSGRVNE